MEDSAVEITQAEWKQEKSNLNKDNLRELWDNISHTSNHIRGISKWDYNFCSITSKLHKNEYTCILKSSNVLHNPSSPSPSPKPATLRRLGYSL